MVLKIRVNDKVIILTGKDKGKISKVKNIISKNKVLVTGINLVKKHIKTKIHLNQPGGILQKELPINISNIAILNPNTNKADRIGFIIKQGKKFRIFKSNKKIIE